MQAQTTTFGRDIISVAEPLLRLNCFENPQKSNKGQCISEIKQAFNNAGGESVSVKGAIPYCAITVSHILDQAFELHGITPSPLRTPRAYDFVTLGRKMGIRVDNKPAPGAVGVKDATTGHHALLVWFVTDDGYVWTIEGNTYGGQVYNPTADCLVKTQKEGIISRIHPPGKIKNFVHVEEYFPNDQIISMDLPGFNPNLAGLSNDGGDSCATDYEVSVVDNEPNSDNVNKAGIALPIGIGAALLLLLWKLKS